MKVYGGTTAVTLMFIAKNLIIVCDVIIFLLQHDLKAVSLLHLVNIKHLQRFVPLKNDRTL